MKSFSVLRWADALPTGAALGLGVALGAVLGVVFLTGLPLVLGAGLFLAVLALAGGLAWSGDFVAVAGTASEEELAEPALSVELVSIPAGRFRMGSPDDEEGRWEWEGPVHEVRVSAFQCMKYPVTRRLYLKVMGKDRIWHIGKANERPMTNVSWLDAIRFCIELSKKDGLQPCYKLEGDNVRRISPADGYRLATEAEWEYACRAGTETRWSFGDKEKDLRRHGWYTANSGSPQPVGKKNPNPWGLHDMHGNVWEWCWDWYGPYQENSQTDPTGPLNGTRRVLRGGSFADGPGVLRSAGRGWFGPGNRGRDLGFRCVRVSGRQP